MAPPDEERLVRTVRCLENPSRASYQGGRREDGNSSPRFNVYQASKVISPFPMTCIATTCSTDVGPCERRQHVSLAHFSSSMPRKGLFGSFSREFDRGQAPRIKARMTRGTAAKNTPPASSTWPPLPQTERHSSRGSTLARAEVRCSLSRSGLQLSSQGNPKEICEVELEGYGLAQILQVRGRFAGRIVERAGPFSRRITVPLVSKGFSDPEEATRGLARLPPSAVRRRVHVLSDRENGVGTFIYVGDLGLLGGGDREPPAGGGALGRQAAASSRPEKKHSLVSPDIFRHYAGRKEEFSQLFEAFTSSGESVVAKAIAGPAGIGKTQLAIKVFEWLKMNDSYDHTFWIPSDSKENLYAAFLNIAEYLEISADDEIPVLVRRVHQELGGSRCLYVFDDAFDLELIREYLPPEVGHAIVTTRNAVAGSWEGDTVQLGPFDECDAWFLAHSFGYTRSPHSEGLDDLIELLPPYPLTLAQFFSMMKYEGVPSPAEWLHQVERYAPSRYEAGVIEMLSEEHDVRGASAMVYLFRSNVLSILREPDDLVSTHSSGCRCWTLGCPSSGCANGTVKEIVNPKQRRRHPSRALLVCLVEREEQSNLHSRRDTAPCETPALTQQRSNSRMEREAREKGRRQSQRSHQDHRPISGHDWRTSFEPRIVDVARAESRSSNTARSADIRKGSRALLVCLVERRRRTLASGKRPEEQSNLRTSSNHAERHSSKRALARHLATYVQASRTTKQETAMPFEWREPSTRARRGKAEDGLEPEITSRLLRRTRSRAGRSTVPQESPRHVRIHRSTAVGLERKRQRSTRCASASRRRPSGPRPMHPELRRTRERNDMCGLAPQTLREALPFDKRATTCASASTATLTIRTSSNASRTTPPDSREREETAKHCRSQESPRHVRAPQRRRGPSGPRPMHPELRRRTRSGKRQRSTADKRALDMCERLNGDADHPDLVQCIQSYAGLGLRSQESPRKRHPDEALPSDSEQETEPSTCASASTATRTIRTSSNASRATPPDSREREETAKHCRSAREPSTCASASTATRTIRTSSYASGATPSDSREREETAKHCRSSRERST